MKAGQSCVVVSAMSRLEYRVCRLDVYVFRRVVRQPDCVYGMRFVYGIGEPQDMIRPLSGGVGGLGIPAGGTANEGSRVMLRKYCGEISIPLVRNPATMIGLRAIRPW